jgi:hypothetical protein
VIITKPKFATPEIQQASDHFDEMLGREIPGKMGKPDWSYRDLPKMPKDDFRQFEDALGSENIEWITIAGYPDGSKRGQLLISPEGMSRIKIHDNGEWEITDE